ncbi:protein PFC0760c-like [Oppia nitens]|uniref:protein PFC0760c-like n=1 Tax=Oppia nitens TaxID=1686743 RepID=UPI0023DBB830|nr:protein PFC0760c-like [Oppia nitens]
MMCIEFNLLFLTLTVLISWTTSLSLNEIHSLSHNFKSISHNNNNDKSLKDAIKTIQKRRQQTLYPLAHLYGPYSLPVTAIEYYKRLVPIDTHFDEELIDVPFDFDAIRDSYRDDSTKNDLISTALALKLSHVFDKQKDKTNINHKTLRKEINKKRKRSTNVKQNTFRNVKQIAFKPKDESFKNNNFLNSHKTNGIINSNTKPKHKSGRRVLTDHFHIEEDIIDNNKNLITKRDIIKKLSPISKNSKKLNLNKKSKTTKNQLNFKHINKSQTLTKKKSITKRKAENKVIEIKSLSNNKNNKTSKFETTINTDKSIVSELYDILSDDNKNNEKIITQLKSIDKNTSKNDNKSQPKEILIKNDTEVKYIKKVSKRSNLKDQTNNEDIVDNGSDYNIENDNQIIYPIETIDDKTEVTVENTSEDQLPINNKEMNDWLRKEYYETIAAALATMRRKRSNDINDNDVQNDEDLDDFTNINNIETKNEDLIAINQNNKKQPFDDKDDDYVIATLYDDNEDDTDIINDNNREDNNEKDDSIIWEPIQYNNNNVKQKTKRSVNSIDESDSEETNDIDLQRFSHINSKLESIEDTLLSDALELIDGSARRGSHTEAENNKIADRLDAAYDIENMRNSLEDLHNTIDNINNENIIQDNDLTTSTSESSDNQIDIIIPEDYSDSIDECFAIEMLSSDCSSVANLMPNSRLYKAFKSACDWHNICYTCGEIYGLLSSDCDAGFLEAGRLACNDSPSCETFSRIVLTPLRQSRVFYKSSVPDTCFRYHCIRDYLFQTQTNK